MKTKKFIAIIFLGLLSGCGVVPFKGYDGPTQPKANLATLIAMYDTSDPSQSFVTFTSLDGKPTPPFARLLMLLPSDHAFIGRCQFWNEGGAEKVFTVKHRFSAGKKYEIICHDIHGHATAKIREIK